MALVLLRVFICWVHLEELDLNRWTPKQADAISFML